MFEIIQSGGFMMWPLILASVVAMAIIGERLWSLQRKYVAPDNLMANVRQWVQRGEVDHKHIAALREHSALGRILAAGLANRGYSRDVLREAVEDAGRHAGAELERYLNALGTIASISPFLGLLGTVFGMIEMFSGLGAQGVGDPAVVARGIAQALIATAAGLIVAIPSLLFYRYFRGRVQRLLLAMEQEAIALIEILGGQRARE